MSLTLWPVTGVGEVGPGDDLVSLLLERLDEPLRDGDVVVVTSKIVSKALGLSTAADRDCVIDAETVRVVARRGATRIVRNRAGLTMAAAGVDASNTAPGTALWLPHDPDAAARDLRVRLRRRAGVEIAVVLSDTAGRAWRRGQTDIAIGSAGLKVVNSLSGTQDTFGNALHVTEPAVADEIAGAAELVAGKTSQAPFVVVRGLPRHWVGDHWAHPQSGAATLLRPDDEDLFGLGARDAVEVAVGTGRPVGFPAPEPDAYDRVLALAAPAEALVEVTATDPATFVVAVKDDSDEALVEAGRVSERLRVAARAHGVDVAIEVRPSGARGR
ncbi:MULTISPECIES: coenzyme F420-0:L-glutamate ligase [Mumia]|uniref:coenzyme F420-0:L-glutamate ligase n=1 Tax=Mumia TaxID=1546255 RepID=UPI00141F5F38|nr:MULTISPECIES: coenzyme F420-0:L-glutamate ligase [unclassified Mumia]QMW65586.1 coenzyme F420-0:L-glutamate ligase [Mumia sp. ZJ1417]